MSFFLFSLKSYFLSKYVLSESLELDLKEIKFLLLLDMINNKEKNYNNKNLNKLFMSIVKMFSTIKSSGLSVHVK